MAMEIRPCRECGKTCWHNSLPAKEKDRVAGWRCTYCGSPVGTGPKADRTRELVALQIHKARHGQRNI